MATEESYPEPMSREEAKRILRRLELDAYSAIVTAFRAQGDINKSKKNILNELSNHLSISTERHRAEVRRVVNDDRLNAVAGCMHGPGSATEWSIEGRRLVSLMPRLVPQTVFTAKATAAANQAVESNKKLPIKTEIEVLPLPTKSKQMSKNDRIQENKDDNRNVKMSSLDLPGKLDDKLKKKKKPNILYTKPSPLALNKTLTNPFKPSNPSSLKPMIKSSSLKPSSSYTVSKPASTISPVKYSPKPIILQRSPTKSQSSFTKPTNIQLQSLSSTSVNSPLTSLGALSSSKSDSSLHLIQSPMIKVVSNSIQTSNSSTAVSVSSLQNSSITQKIKFKTPLPKPKVKATKFKPMVPLQRSGLLSSAQNSDGIMLGVSNNITSPVKSVSGPQGVSVKVVQVAKSGISTTSPSINSNKPVVVVSSNKSATQKLMAVSSAATSLTQHNKSSTNFNCTSSVTQTIAKGTLPSKSMPLATGFKMIAVTTVVPGTTQVKTVYIATPIMSLTKTISQTTGSSITTPASQSVKHIANSLASNLHSVVARSMNTAVLNHGKSTSIQNTSLTANIATPSIAIGKASKIASTSKGLGSLKTTLPSSAQSLKLFTTVSKSRSPLAITHTMKNPPLLPSTSLLSSIVGSQSVNRIGNIQIKNSNTLHRPDKQQVLNVSHTAQTNNCDASNVNITGNTQHLTIGNDIATSGQLHPAAITLNVNSLEDVNTTLNLLNEDSNTLVEQIANSTIRETDDMAFLNAGEKFLEQLSAKMTATSPDSLTKDDSFIFAGNLGIDMSREQVTQVVFDANHLETFQNDIKQTTMSKEVNYLINQKTPGAHNVGIVTSKVITNNLSNNITLVNAKFNLVADSGVVNSATLATSKLSVPGTLTVSAPSFQKNERNVVNYSNITKVNNKMDTVNLYGDGNTMGFLNITNSLTIDNSTNPNLKLSSLNQSNKLQMSIPGSTELPGSSKLNISPALVNNNISKHPPADLFNQVCTSTTSLKTTTVSTNQKKTLTAVVSTKTMPVSLHNNNNTNVTISDGISTNTQSDGEPPCNGKKRRLNDNISSPGRTQASWIRGAANLLARVCRFRGTNKQKGEMNAASWFTKPVDPNDAPGYYRIVKVPMDFGKIKKKLEDGEYDSYPHFYEDMKQIKKNCYLYNPDGHIARKDCDDVFSFFESEYQKLLERWEKHHVSPHKKVKLNDDLTNST